MVFRGRWEGVILAAVLQVACTWCEREGGLFVDFIPGRLKDRDTARDNAIQFPELAQKLFTLLIPGKNLHAVL